jgi:raffinose/stachyose/melibiose transport system permease protein
VDAAAGRQHISTQYGTDTALVLAYTVLSIVPALILYAIAERHIVSGVTSGAVKG